MKIRAMACALAGGVLFALMVLLITICGLAKLPGYGSWFQIIEEAGRPYGYTFSAWGLLIGPLYGFVKGFVYFGLFALLYNWMLHRTKRSEP